MPAWNTVTLVTDDDLTALESSMPGLAKRQTSGSKSPLDGKRALAKTEIERYIRRRGFDPDSLTDPVNELKAAAAYLELSMIYQDMAQRGEGSALEKSAFYFDRWQQEREELVLSYSDSTSVPDSTPKIRLGTVELRRA